MAPKSFLSTAISALIIIRHVSSFTVITTKTRNQSPVTTLHMKTNDDSSRRAFLSNVALAGITTAATFSPYPALAAGLTKINSKLISYGLPPIGSVPDGFTPLLELYGKSSNRDPLLVEFLYPFDWIVQLPNIDKNSEEGTIQAGNYGSGDTATLYIIPGKTDNVASQSKDFYRSCVIKAISQKGDGMYQDFKVTKVEPISGEYKDQKYVIVDFKYTLLTGAGFEVDRSGIASVTSVGENTQVLWTASTRTRYKKLEDKLRVIAQSFRCYSEGLQLSAGLKKQDDDLF